MIDEEYFFYMLLGVAWDDAYSSGSVTVKCLVMVKPVMAYLLYLILLPWPRIVINQIFSFWGLNV